MALVTHMKAQLAIGKNHAEDFMSQNVFLQHVSDVSQLPNYQQWLAFSLKKKKLQKEHAIIVVITDYSKCGVVSQAVVNRHSAAISSVVEAGPENTCGVILQPLLYGAASGCSLLHDMRMIEDKLTSSRQELRKICVGVDLSQCHGNRCLAWFSVLPLPHFIDFMLSCCAAGDTPGFMEGWISVPDTMLPLKGVGFRPPKTYEKPDRPEKVNL